MKRIKSYWLTSFLGLLVVTCGCTPGDREYTRIDHPRPISKAYQLAKRGTIQGDYYWAARAKTLAEAEQRWKQYIQDHGPYKGGWDDAPHLNHFLSARQELMRIYYMLGKTEEADAILRDFDPVDPKY